MVSMIAIGILCENEEIFSRAVELYQDIHINGSIAVYVSDWGQSNVKVLVTLPNSFITNESIAINDIMLSKQILTVAKENQKTLPVQVSNKVYIGEQAGIKAGKKVYVYHYNSTTKKLDSIPGGYSCVIDADGYLSLPIIKGGDYVVLAKKADATVTLYSGKVKTYKTTVTVR